MAKSRVLIDGFNLGLEAGTGVATYARNLSYCVHDLGHDVDVVYGNRAAPGYQQLLHEIAFFDTHAGDPPAWLKALRYFLEGLSAPTGAVAKQVPITGQVIATHYKSRLPYYDRILNAPDVFGKAERYFALTQFLWGSRLKLRMRTKPAIAHWTYPLPLYVPGAKNVYTFHDLVPLRLPFTTLDNKRFYFNLVRTLARRSDHIVTVSETSRRDIINLLGVPEHKVTNTYQSVEIPDKYANKGIPLIKRDVEGTFGLPYKGYVLYYGAVEPKKNIGRLIEAYLASEIETPLVIVGKTGWKSEQEFRLMNEDIVSFLEQRGPLTFKRHRIFRFDYAPFPLLVSLIQGAKFVTFPSLYEGFGLPVLEAMKLGTPVLTSREGATAEVAGNNALVVDPYDVRVIAEGIKALDTDADLRARLSEMGIRRAAEFSAAAHASKIQDVYARLGIGAKKAAEPSVIRSIEENEAISRF